MGGDRLTILYIDSTDDKPPQKWAWSGHMTHLFLGQVISLERMKTFMQLMELCEKMTSSKNRKCITCSTVVIEGTIHGYR